MSAEVWGALILFVLITLTALGTVIKMVPDWIRRAVEVKLKLLEKQLETNTKITQETHDLSNGRLHAVQARAEVAEQQVAEQRDLLRYLAKHAEVTPLLQAYQDRRER